MYKSQFRKIDTYDWFCAPGSHIQMSSDEYSACSLSYIDVFRSTQTMIRGCWWVSGTGRSSEACFRPTGAAAWTSWDAGSNTTAIPSSSDSAGCLQRSCAPVHTHTNTHTHTHTLYTLCCFSRTEILLSFLSYILFFAKVLAQYFIYFFYFFLYTSIYRY